MQSGASSQIPPADALHRLIEAEPLAPNVRAFLDDIVRRNGDKPAFSFFEAPAETPFRSLTYRQFDTHARKLASAFHGLGIRKGHHVGVMLPNVPAWPLTWMALAHLGAVIVPINVRYTARELGFVLGDSDAQWLVIHGNCLSASAGLETARPEEGRVVVVDGPVAAGRHHWFSLVESGDPAFDAPEQPALDDLATILYTSGTTGFPKGVMLPHRYWLTFVKHGTMEIRYMGIERALLCQPFYYMAGQGWFLYGLFLGAETFVAPQLSIRRFMPWVRQTRSQYALASNAILKQDLPPEDRINDLKFMHVGAAYTKETQAEIERAFGCIVRNCYGMTENAIATYVPITATDRLGPDAIGIPTPFREVMIGDENGRPVPDGQDGEILTRGPGLLHGYYKKPDANKASFFGEWHRSGDRGYRDKDGYFHLLGRMKDVIRRNGENISALEVETVLLSLPAILRAAAIAVPDSQRGEELKVCVVLNPGFTREQVPPDVIADHCARNLASFKVPRYVEYLDDMPTTVSGKVEKHALKTRADLRAGSYDRVDQVWR